MFGHTCISWNKTLFKWLCSNRGFGIQKKKFCGNLNIAYCSVQFSHSVVFDSVIPWTAARQASLSITNSQSLLKRTSIELVMTPNNLILYRPLLLPPSIFPSIRVFANESVLCITWKKYWSFSFSVSPSNEYSGLISFRMDWFDLPEVQGTLQSILQHHSKSINSLVLSFLYSPTLTSIHDYWKNHSLTRWTFVGKVMSLLFNMLSIGWS